MRRRILFVKENAMRELWLEIQKFKTWAKRKYPGLPLNASGGEWETAYEGWDTIKALFEKTIKNSRPDDFADAELSELVYIIARNNEDEALAEYLSCYTEWFMKLGELSLLLNEPEARWQFAIRLKEMTDKKRAGVLLEKFVNDDNEYVSRRALMELPALLPDKVEAYSTWFWPRDVYGDWQEYQRMAVLTALKEIRSPLLGEYLKRAREDGRIYLVRYADEISSEIQRMQAE